VKYCYAMLFLNQRENWPPGTVPNHKILLR
jgi:hypothetical protein